jgi:ComF family protein
MKKPLMKWIIDFISLVYPEICACCGRTLWQGEEIICAFCEYHLPRTHFHLDYDNPVNRIFWGRSDIESAGAFLFFNKGNNVQRLIHLLKYKGRKEIGVFLGKRYGLLLKDSFLFGSVDLIIPIPLHRKKFKTRGYNQSEQFALGLSHSMKVPVGQEILIRTKPTETQTRKSRFHRFENVSDIFVVNNAFVLQGHHILLVDDVITTGSTMEACISAFRMIPGLRISVAAIATTV